MVHEGENCGFVSLWLGNFESEAQLDDYLNTVYWDFDNETEMEFQKKLSMLLQPENAKRPIENAFKKVYDESYNQFEYDFAMFFDEDFMERVFFDKASNSTSALIGKHSWYQTYKHEFIALLGETLTKAYNAVVLIYDYRYNNSVKHIRHERFEIEFMGAVPFEKIPPITYKSL